ESWPIVNCASIPTECPCSCTCYSMHSFESIPKSSWNAPRAAGTGLDCIVTELVAPGTDSLKLETFLPYRLAVASSVTAQALAVVYAAHGLTQAEWVILTAIAERPGTTAKAIGATFHMQKAKVSRGVSSLQRRKLINTTLHRGDRRLIELQLTPE